MREETLLKISLGTAIAGLIAIYFAGQYMSTASYPIAQLDGDILGRQVKISGVVASAKTTEDGHSFLTVRDETGSISVVAFTGKRLQIPERGARVEVTGRLDEYKGRIEIIAEKIRII